MGGIMKLGGKVALVTGAAQGIGKAVALLLARNGADVVVSDINLKKAEETAKEIQGLGRKALVVKVDVSKEGDVENMISETLKVFNRVDILVNNAGTNHPNRNVIDLTLVEWNRVFEVNLTGPFLCCRAVLPTMIQQHSGKIINISSVGARYAAAGRSPYRCSKLALLQFTYCLAAEVKQYGIDVNAVCPGSTETQMMQEIIAREGRFPVLMHPEEIAEVVVFLTSEQSSAITGTAIDAFGPDNPLFR